MLSVLMILFKKIESGQYEPHSWEWDLERNKIHANIWKYTNTDYLCSNHLSD